MIPFYEITTLYVAPHTAPDGASPAAETAGGTEPAANGRGWPFPSLEAAFDYIRELRRQGIAQPITVRLLPGLHRFLEPVVVDAGVYGVTVLGDPASRVIGGVRVEGWRRDTYRGAACFSAPIPPEAKDPAAPGGIDFIDLYVNGTRAKMTRYPESGYLYADEVDQSSGVHSKWFVAQAGDWKDFSNVDRIRINYFHYWIDEHSPIESYDPATRRVTMRYPSARSIAGERGSISALEYWLENVAETFSRPDEWYADGDRLYYIPRDESMTPETLDAVIPRTSRFFIFKGTEEAPVRGVTLRGLTLSGTRGEYLLTGEERFDRNADRVAGGPQSASDADGVISFRFAHNCTVEDCRIENYGLYGVNIHTGCHGIRILRSLFRDGGAGGVRVCGGDVNAPAARQTWGNTIEDCRILYCGRRYAAGCGVLLMHTYENTVAHNEIGYLYYTGVSVGWVWGYAPSVARDNRILKNHIHHIGGGMLSDMGGVYLLGRQPGTVVSGNVIHDVRAKKYGGWALYTDEGSSFITLEDNICYDTSENSFHQHYGSLNTLRNNIFAYAGTAATALVRVTRTEAHMSLLAENNIFYASGNPMLCLQPTHLTNHTVSSKRNLFFDAARPEPAFVSFMNGYRENADGKTLTEREAREAGLEYGTVVADPLFADPEKRDFRLAPESPAFALGFVPIDVSDVGPRRGDL